MLEDFLRPLTETEIFEWEVVVSDWVFLLSLLYLCFEVVRSAMRRKLNWTVAGDAATSFVTFAFFVAVTLVLLGGFYLTAYYVLQPYALFEIESTWLTIGLCILLADFAYYWEHRMSHRVGIVWATHSVHHSSPYFNISVAYRFGVMDALWPLLFHMPMVLIGFEPVVVLFSSAMVQAYQTFLHTDTIGKLPRPVEAVFNTPSHHRVHHGSNPYYLDKNYGGVFIVWDRLFGTFAEEREKVAFGLVKPLRSINPVVVSFHGFYRLGKDLWAAEGVLGKLRAALAPPGEGAQGRGKDPVSFPAE